MRSGASVSTGPAPTSTRRHRRSGACGESALQCAAGNTASASEKVGDVWPAVPCAAAQSPANSGSSSMPAHSSSTSRSNGESVNTLATRSKAGGLP